MATIIIIIILIILLLVIFWQVSLFWAAIIGSPIVYAFPEAVYASLDLAKLKKGETLVDLGSGNGRTLILAAKRYGAKGVGVDRSLFCYIKARINVWLAGESKNIKIIWGDFKKAEKYMKSADVIYLYLLSTTMVQIEDWFFAHVGDKTRIVSLAFEFAKHKSIASVPTYTHWRHNKARLYKKTN